MERVDGRGNYISETLQSRSRDSYEHSNYTLPNTTEGRRVLAKMLLDVRQDPALRNDSIFFKNLYGGGNLPFFALSVPRGSISYPYELESGHSGYPDGETYVVNVFSTSDDRQLRQELVVVNNPDSAKRIAGRRLRNIGWGRSHFRLWATLLPEDEFLEIAKSQIDRNEELTSEVMRHTELRDYKKEHDSQKVKHIGK